MKFTPMDGDEFVDSAPFILIELINERSPLKQLEMIRALNAALEEQYWKEVRGDVEAGRPTLVPTPQ